MGRDARLKRLRREMRNSSIKIERPEHRPGKVAPRPANMQRRVYFQDPRTGLTIATSDPKKWRQAIAAVAIAPFVKKQPQFLVTTRKVYEQYRKEQVEIKRAA